MKPFDEELVSGNVIRSVWKLAWPSMLLNLVNGMHGFVDHVLVGNLIGTEGNGGIGIAWQVFLVVVVFIASLFHGMGVLVARYAGRKDRETLSNVVYQTLLASGMILVFIVGPLGYMGSPFLVSLANADDAVGIHALPYLRVMFTCGAPLFLMFLLTGAQQASGDPKTPLMLGILSTLLNIGLSIILIMGLGPFPQLGSTGAALATCMAPLPSVAISLWLIWSGRVIIHRPAHLTLKLDFEILKSVARIGIPTGLQAVLLNIGGVAVLWFIGSLPNSTIAQGVFVICYSQLFSFVTFVGFGLRAACASFIGQNIGANQPDRASAGIRVGAVMGALWASFVGSLFWILPAGLLGLFGVKDIAELAIGMPLLRILALSGLVLVISQAYTGGLQGAGDTKKPMYIAFVSQILVVLGTCAAFYAAGALTATVIWLAILGGHCTRLLLSYIVFQRGAWRHVKVSVGR